MPDDPKLTYPSSEALPTAKRVALDSDAILTVLEDVCSILLESLTMQLSVEHRTALEGHMSVLRKLTGHPDPAAQQMKPASHDKEPADI